MSILTSLRKKTPTTQQDYQAYTNGANKTTSATYTTYVQSVEALDKVVRTIGQIASMARLEVFKKVKNEPKPFKINGLDLEFGMHPQISQGEIWAMTFGSIVTQGSAVIIPEKAKDLLQFFPYDPSRFEVNANENNMIAQFRYTSTGGAFVDFKPEEIIYIAPRIDASNFNYAQTRLKALTDILTLQSSIMGQQKEFYTSGGKNSSIISPKEPLSQEKAEALKGAFDNFLKTTATKTLFLNTDVDVSTVSNAQSPAAVMDALTKINSVILQQFGVPEYFFGNYQGYVNDAAIITASRIFFQVHMKPIFEAIAYQFTRYFRGTQGIKDVYFKFSYKDVEILEDNLSVKIENAGKMYKLGLISMNEARKECELEPIDTEAADRHFLPAYLTGQYPVSIEEFDDTMSKLFATNGIPQDTTLGTSGTTGGSDNTNMITDSNGGNQ